MRMRQNGLHVLQPGQGELKIEEKPNAVHDASTGTSTMGCVWLDELRRRPL